MPRLHAFLAAWRDLRGWRRYAAALLLGALLAAAQAPLSLWPLAFVAFIALLHLDADMGEDRAAQRRSFFTQFAFAYGYFVAGLYWIGIAFFVDAEKYALLLPLPVLGLPVVLAAFPATAIWLARSLSHGRRGLYFLLLPFGWLIGEWLRGHVATGFPWNIVGYVWSGWPAAMQPVAWIGSHGLGLVTMLAAAGFALALLPGRLSRLGLLLPLLLIALIGAGSARLPAGAQDTVPGVQLRLVQPSIVQTLKWQDSLRQQHLQQHVALSLQPAAVPITHYIWPETAIPYLLDEEPGLRTALARLLPPGGALVTGAPRREVTRRGLAAQGELTLYNSIFVLGSDGGIPAHYDKVHLVPFGEYLPFRKLLHPLGLDALAAGAIDFSPGSNAAPLAIPGLPDARTLICYEAIFPEEAGSDAGLRPGLLLNVTNDAWFGRSSGPYQHLAAARFRAIEQGLPMVRAANNGISAIVDPYGRIVTSLGLDAVGVLDGPLPLALPDRPPYARIGDAPLLAFALAVLILAFVFGRVRIKH